MGGRLGKSPGFVGGKFSLSSNINRVMKIVNIVNAIKLMIVMQMFALRHAFSYTFWLFQQHPMNHNGGNKLRFYINKLLSRIVLMHLLYNYQPNTKRAAFTGKWRSPLSLLLIIYLYR